MDSEFRKQVIPENIVVYRFTQEKYFKQLFSKSKPKVGEIFICKGFTSSTLFPESLLEFAENRNYNCILKLYLPKGSKCAYTYIWQNNRLPEQEILLPTNCTFRLIKKGIWSRKPMPIYECILIEQSVNKALK